MLAKGPASRFPVSKSRLEACGSSVPRPRTAPSAHPEKPKAMGAELSLSTAESSSKLEQEYIYNLQQQVYLQELELKYVKQQKASNTFDASTSEPVEASLHNIKGTYKHMETDFAKRLEQEEARQSELREEALRAVMHEKRAHAEKTKVVEELARVREQFSSQRQELTAEVVGLQRELEKCFLHEKTLRTELEQASAQLKDLRTFSDGADAQACQRERERGSAVTSVGHDEGVGAHPSGLTHPTRRACAGAHEELAAGGECEAAGCGGGEGGQLAEGAAG